MSKYSGSITIVNDSGESVFERELLPDEIIEEVLRGMPPLNVGNIGSVMKQTKKNIKGANRKVGDPKECCGSKGARHFKWCKEIGGNGINLDGPVRKNGLVGVGITDDLKPVMGKDNKMRFSRVTYFIVKKMYANGASTDSIVADKGFDAEELRKIRISQDYEAYVRA